MGKISLTEDEVLKEIKTILKDYYLQYSKKTILVYEQVEGKLSRKAVHELRDALDHIAIAISDGRKQDQIIRDLNAAREHFRRVAIDPLEYLAEEKFRKIVRLRKYGLWWWRLFLINPPSDIDKEIRKIVDFLVIGRENKGVDIEKSFNNMWDAYDLARDLLDKIKPIELRSRIFALVCVLLGVLLSVSFRTLVAYFFK